MVSLLLCALLVLAMPKELQLFCLNYCSYTGSYLFSIFFTCYSNFAATLNLISLSYFYTSYNDVNSESFESRLPHAFREGRSLLLPLAIELSKSDLQKVASVLLLVVAITIYLNYRFALY